MTTALLAYRYGYYGFHRSPLIQGIVAIVLIWIGISGIFSREGKYDDRSFFEMNAAYLLSLLAGLALGAYMLRGMFGGE